jgi:anti-sigma factor RsiW
MAMNPACKTYLPMLSPFIDGELVPAERATVERHLGACPDCTGRVADLRAESGLIRLGMEMLAEEADFTGFAQKVMARVTPERSPLWERLKLAVSETFLHQRGALLTAAATVTVVVLGALLLLRDGTPTGYASERVAVQEVTVEEGARVAPVVMSTENGNTIIWLVNQPERKKRQGEEEEEEVRDGQPPRGGEL